MTIVVRRLRMRREREGQEKDREKEMAAVGTEQLREKAIGKRVRTFPVPLIFNPREEMRRGTLMDCHPYDLSMWCPETK